MLVAERMSHPVITIYPDMSIVDALSLMRKERIRRLPVVNRQGRLVGIVSERDLLHAHPSDATSLSIWELNYIINRVAVREIMTQDVIVVRPDTPLEEAARVMADHKVGGLPVVVGSRVVGVITETDLFKAFLELMGAREAGVRIALLVPDTPDELPCLTRAICDAGGKIVALGTFLGESCETREVAIKVYGIDPDTLERAVQPFVNRIIDVRETHFVDEAAMEAIFSN